MSNRIIIDDGEGAPVIDLEVVRYERTGHGSKLACQHWHVIVDTRKNTLTCRDCQAEVSATWYLERLVEHWSRTEARRKRAEEAIVKAEKRCRTKCEHCHEMTRIRGVW